MHYFLTLILIINIPHDVFIVDNIFINNYTLEECTYHCITLQQRTLMMVKHDRNMQVLQIEKNTYHLCILLVFIMNYTTTQSVEHIKHNSILDIEHKVRICL
jgi:hypothetical protein